MKRHAASLGIAFALACGVALVGQVVRAQPPVWVARGAHSTLILFGSVHLLPHGLDWRPPVLTDGLAKADELWFEIPIGAATDAEAIRLTRARGLLRKGDTLSAHLTAAQRERLARDASRVGLPALALEPMSPWLAEFTLSLADDAKAGALASEGVERQVQNLTSSKAVRRAFETPRQQISFLAGGDMAQQVTSLALALKQIDDQPDSYRRLIAAWMTGDLSAIEAEDLTPLRAASPAIYKRLITDRNQRWAARLRRRLEGSGTIVVIVGMGHLIGPGGVPALLRAKGLQVDGP